jgi:aryl-alcohol dehydrogenase-like predicted oxidoreductase
LSADQNVARRICLGTAQLGMDYGVTNTTGRPDDRACEALLSRAIERGVLMWDTARDYGDAEQRLGRFLKNHSRHDEVKIVTKVRLPADVTDLTAWITAELDNCRTITGCEQLEALLLHDPELMEENGDRVWEAFNLQVDRGAVRRVGASVYDPHESNIALDCEATSAIQLPFNLLDSRAAVHGTLERCQQRNVTVLTRSALLQGAMTLAPGDIPSRLMPLREPLQRLHELLTPFGVAPADIALPYVLSHPQIDYLVIGVDDVIQLDNNLDRAGQQIAVDLASQIRAAFTDLDSSVVEARQWEGAT